MLYISGHARSGYFSEMNWREYPDCQSVNFTNIKLKEATSDSLKDPLVRKMHSIIIRGLVYSLFSLNEGTSFVFILSFLSFGEH